MFLELARLENRRLRLQVLKLVDELEREALAVFRIGRRLERKTWTDPKELGNHGRKVIVERLRKKFASEYVALADTDSLDEQLEASPSCWHRQGGLLLDCAEALNVHVAVYEYLLVHRREHDGGRSPSVAHDYLAGEQHRFGLDDDQVTRSLVDVSFITDRETFVAHFRENVIKRHRLRWLKRNPAAVAAASAQRKRAVPRDP